ncbi:MULTISPECIES: GNAT family N-acetyltransferase [Novosphingobium]|uniref:Protein N-acetyltransferase, RimJ/RimL family n=1 Tax=Novosphingobium mathurense TaxID=428990 RepID=A0A1U6IGA3_9SPHN|nr:MULTISPECIES: GNAT family N-acetyltransferase [Novosphingobium]SLK07039.1 Protein N-acetyltransferase, RimJ/RimL family [Novosphingobium mathurense]
MFIRSDRLFLRPAWPEDLQELETLIAHDSAACNLASACWPCAHDDARRFVAHEQAHALPQFVITVPGTGGSRIVGCIGLDRRDGEVELCYWIARDQRGRGYAGEAVKAVVDLAWTLGHARIVANHFVDSPASGRVLHGAGFRRTGRVAERYSVTRKRVFPAREYVLAPAGSDGFDDEMNGLRVDDEQKRAA